MTKPYAFALQRTASAAQRPAKPRFDVASVVDIGARDYQQDALVANFPCGDDIGIAVLADGMGGHLGGEVASNVALSTAFAEVKLNLVHYRAGQVEIPQALSQSISDANAAVAEYIQAAPELDGMGTTLVACVAAGPDLYWASVGDSPLYLCRDGDIQRLNEDHSMGPQIDAMATSGLIDPSQAAAHPQRNQLVSAICGGRVSHVDCPKTPFKMKTGDIVLLASDGLQTLADDEIARIVRKRRRGGAAELARALVQAVVAAADPEQDNTSVVVIKLECDDALALPPSPDRAGRDAPLKLTAPKFPDDPDVEQASDLLNKALLL